MSSKKRKQQAKNLRASVISSVIMLLFALAVFVYMIYGVAAGGMKQIILPGLAMIIFLFGAGYFISPVLKHMKEKRQENLKKRGFS